MCPVFVRYDRISEVDPADEDNQVLELDFRLIDGKDLGRRMLVGPAIGMTKPTGVNVELEGEGICGVAEFTPVDDSDHFVFWEVDEGVVRIRVHERVITIDTRHQNQPSHPWIQQDEGGEG